MKHAIQVDGLVKSYGSHTVLKGADLPYSERGNICSSRSQWRGENYGPGMH